MKTVREIINSLSHNEWSYYNTDNTDIRLTDAVLSDKNKAIEFIEDYFNLAGKERVLTFPAFDRNKEFVLNRAPHIISTFVLGLKIAECLDIITGDRDESGFSFQYRWFLTCLYHDIGYIYEKKTVCEWLRMTASDGLEAIQAVCDIHYVHDRIFKTYSRDIVDIYLKGRAKCSGGKVGVLDHGIVGGLLLYDGLRKQFERSWGKRTDKLHSLREDFYVIVKGRRLHCSNSHFNEYAKAADAIIAHNIWLDTLQEYLNDEHIDLPVKDKQIKYSENELCFILGLADSIEPLKRFEDFPERAERVFFSFDNGVITIQSDQEIIQGEKGYGRIKDTEKWLGIKVENHTTYVEIHIL